METFQAFLAIVAVLGGIGVGLGIAIAAIALSIYVIDRLGGL